MGDSVVFDMTQHPFDDIVLNLNKMNNNGGYDDVFYMHTKLKQGAENDQFNNKWKIYTTYYSGPYRINTNAQFPISVGERFSITYNLPDTLSLHPFRYKHYYNYFLNYNAINIYLCPISSNGEIMGTFKVTEIPIGVSMVPEQIIFPYQLFQYWDCYSLGYSDIDATYYYDGVLTAHRIQPTVDYTDLWYTEYDQVPRDPNWKQHSTFVAAIDHFDVGIGFGN